MTPADVLSNPSFFTLHLQQCLFPFQSPAIAAHFSAFTNDPMATSLTDSAQHASRMGLLPSVDLRGIFDLRLLNQALAASGRPGVSGL